MSELTARVPEMVTIGTVTMFCERFTSSLSTVLAERATVNGDTLVTGRLRRAARLSFSGRLPADDGAVAEIGRLNNMVGCSGVSVVYRGLAFAGCTLLGYRAEDSCGDFISLTVELAAESPAVITEVGEHDR